MNHGPREIAAGAINCQKEQTMRQIILTGDRPTGRLHVGHYVGSLKGRVTLQNSGKFDEIYIMIADAQALTDNAEHPEKVRSNILQVALDYLACGIDPEKSTIFIQSMIPQLTELTFYYMNLVTVSRVQRNPTVKAEIQMRNFDVKAEIQMRNFEASIPVGFFCYPISQAADITAFRATVVPVGEDQAPMLEQCREIVHKFNAVYGETLTEPDIMLPDNQACLRLPGTDGKAKMSKSLGNCIYLSEEPEEIRQKVMSMYTDPLHIPAHPRAGPGPHRGQPRIHLPRRLLPPRILRAVPARIRGPRRAQGALPARRPRRREGQEIPQQRNAGRAAPDTRTPQSLGSASPRGLRNPPQRQRSRRKKSRRNPSRRPPRDENRLLRGRESAKVERLRYLEYDAPRFHWTVGAFILPCLV